MQRRQPYFPLCSFKNNGSWGRFGDGSEKSTTEAEGCGWLKEPRRVEFNALSGLREPPSLLFVASEIRHLPRPRDYIMIFAPRWVAPALLWRRRVPASFVTVLFFSSWLPFFVSFFNSSLFLSLFCVFVFLFRCYSNVSGNCHQSTPPLNLVKDGLRPFGSSRLVRNADRNMIWPADNRSYRS